MSEEKPISLFNEYKKNKVTPEERIPVHIADGEKQKAALDLVSWLRANKLSPGCYGINRWKASNKGTGICFLLLENDSMRVRLDLTYMKEYEESIMAEGMQKFVFDKISYCHHCAGCKPGIDITLLGRGLKRICRTMILYIQDPDEASVVYIKKLLELEKKARIEKSQK